MNGLKLVEKYESEQRTEDAVAIVIAAIDNIPDFLRNVRTSHHMAEKPVPLDWDERIQELWESHTRYKEVPDDIGSLAASILEVVQTRSQDWQTFKQSLASVEVQPYKLD